MVIELKKNPISDHTERYRTAGLSLAFLQEMAMAVSALRLQVMNLTTSYMDTQYTAMISISHDLAVPEKS